MASSYQGAGGGRPFRRLGAITPLGGLCLIAGRALLAAAALRAP